MKLILSRCVTNNNDVISTVEISEQDKQLTIREDLTNQLEEADVRIIPHIEKAIKNESKRIVVLSNDTDVFALLLHYSHSFFALGMTELWVKYGMGESSRYIPIHIMANKIGPIECSVLFKAHILTGCDVTSKVGTKSAALKANPEMYLLQFGEGDRSRASYNNAEKYLIKVIQPNSKCSSFDELRYNLYLNKKKSISELPPTSRLIESHLDRCYMVIYNNINLLKECPLLNPLLYGWAIQENELLPVKLMLPLPSCLTDNCGCKKGCRGRCKCRKNDTSCTEFCQCSLENSDYENVM